MQGSWFKRVLISFALAVSSLMPIVMASPAQAAAAWPSHSSYSHANYANYANLRSCASQSCPIQARLYNDSTVWMMCWQDGGWATGNYSSNRWFKVYYGTGPVWFIHSSLVYNQASSPNCLA